MRELKTGLAERQVAPRLFENRVGGDCTRIRSSDNNDFTHCSLVAAATMARYSTLVEDQATICCFVEL